MMIKQNLVGKIKEYFDLNIYETKVWIALLSKGVASAGEVASISGVPRSRTYDVLESLEKRGFAIVQIGKPVKYLAVKPTEVLEKMKSLTLTEAQEKVKTLSTLKDTQEYEELELLHKNGISPIKTHEITGSLKGRSNIVTRLRELVQNAKKELLIATSVPDFEDKGRVLFPAIEEAVKRNVKIKINFSDSPEKIKKAKLKLDPSIKVSASNSDSRMYISDKKEVLFMITSENSEEEMGVWLNSPFFASSLVNMASSPKNLKD